jgi:hypothetical protein
VDDVLEGARAAREERTTALSSAPSRRSTATRLPTPGQQTGVEMTCKGSLVDQIRRLISYIQVGLFRTFGSALL